MITYARFAEDTNGLFHYKVYFKNNLDQIMSVLTNKYLYNYARKRLLSIIYSVIIGEIWRTRDE